MTSSVAGCRARMASDRNVPFCQGSSALSRPMREEAPAARMTPANEGERAIANYNPSGEAHSVWISELVRGSFVDITFRGTTPVKPRQNDLRDISRNHLVSSLSCLQDGGALSGMNNVPLSFTGAFAGKRVSGFNALVSSKILSPSSSHLPCHSCTPTRVTEHLLITMLCRGVKLISHVNLSPQSTCGLHVKSTSKYRPPILRQCGTLRTNREVTAVPTMSSMPPSIAHTPNFASHKNPGEKIAPQKIAAS